MKSNKVFQAVCCLLLVLIGAGFSWVVWQKTPSLKFWTGLFRGDHGVCAIENVEMKMANDPTPQGQASRYLQIALGNAYHRNWENVDANIERARTYQPTTYADGSGFASILELLEKAGRLEQAKRICKRGMDECPFFYDKGLGEQHAKKLGLSPPVRITQVLH